MNRGWGRICGLHVQASGQVACVWLAHDKDADTVHLYDEYLSSRDVIAIQADAIKARGAYIPVAWAKDQKEYIAQLDKRGVNVLLEDDVAKNSDAIAEMISLEIHERMETGRFRVKKHLERWLDEYKNYQREASKVPLDTHPLQSATRHAVFCLQYARSQSAHDRIHRKIEYSDVSIA